MDDLTRLQKAAKIAFASEYSFFIKSQFFHWNVEGIHFRELHDLFGTIYEEVYGIIDSFAEKLRSMNTYAPGSLSRLSMLTLIDDQTHAIPAEQMIADLLTDSDNMCKIFKMAYDVAEAEGEHGFSSFLADRMDAHRKHSWQLRSTLK